MFRDSQDFETARAALLGAVDPIAMGFAPALQHKHRPVVHAQNPFIAGLDLKTKRQREALLRAEVVTEERAALEVNEVRQVDRATFAKIFRAALCSAFDLPPAGAKVFFLLLALLETGADAVDLTWRKVWTPAGVGAPLALSRSTLWRGIKALEESQFIAASADKGRYWVNPARLFAGDRLRLVREYQVGTGSRRSAS